MADTGVIAWLALFILTCLTISKANKYARGWGDEIDWVSLDDGLVKAKDLKRPLMVVIHKTWCSACKALKPNFAESKEIRELTKHFIMVNIQDDEEPSDVKYKPDGGYIPRILFLDHEGNVKVEFYNTEGNDKYKYYYPSTEHIVETMKKVQAKIASASENRTEL